MTTKELALMDHLGSFITDHKKQVVDSVLALRSDHLVAVIEDIYQSQNASAVIRTCDCVGMQSVYIVENHNEYIVNPDVALGASKWVDIYRFNENEGSNTLSCFTHLRNNGYRLVGATIDKAANSIFDIDITPKTAIVFGNELRGLSREAVENVDECAHIPMFGFTESFNISVSAAISLYPLYQKIRADTNIDWRLSSDKIRETKLNWFRKIVSRSEVIESEFLKQRSHDG
jgi:tRNA (guanosine-2'-O-)-methyltransferase